MVHRVVLPGRLEASLARKLVECAREITEQPHVVVDASGVGFAQPFGIVTLGAALLRRERAGHAAAQYEAPRDIGAREFLEEVGFDALLRTGQPPGATGTLPIRRASVASIDALYLHQVAQLVERLVPDTSEAVAYLIETALKEMLQNVVEHAESTTDAIILTRWYHQHHNVRIAIADSGIGIAQALSRNPKYAHVQKDTELVRLAATVEGTTGRTTGRFGGLGLKRLRDICLERGGSIHITSGTVDAHYILDKDREAFAPRLQGSTVEIDFRPGPNLGSRAAPSDEDFF